MKKIFVIAASILLLSGCTHSQTPSNSVSENPDSPITPAEKQTTLTAAHLPEGWIIENDAYYSREMYPFNEGGPYSLLISTNKEFSSIKEYFESKKDCVNETNETTINSNPAVQYTNTCMNASPRITIFEMDGKLIEAFSYSISDENDEIIKILGSLTLE